MDKSAISGARSVASIGQQVAITDRFRHRSQKRWPQKVTNRDRFGVVGELVRISSTESRQMEQVTWWRVATVSSASRCSTSARRRFKVV